MHICLDVVLENKDFIRAMVWEELKMQKKNKKRFPLKQRFKKKTTFLKKEKCFQFTCPLIFTETKTKGRTSETPAEEKICGAQGGKIIIIFHHEI